MNELALLYIGMVSALFIVFYFAGMKKPAIKKASIVFFLLFQLIYLIWRSVYTLPSVGWLSLIAGLVLLFTEWAGFSQNIVTSLLFWKKNKRSKKSLSGFDSLPTVDVMIATYNESVPLLKRTITASQMMDYPSEKMSILVCDDGNREDIRLLCEKLGVRHVTRETNEHAKAGNLNHALSVSQGDIVVTMDADMIPRANFLTKTVGYFADERTAFVQAPQAFYNDDPFQFNLFAGDRISNEQDFFMRLIEEQKDRFNATMYVGSNALFRREAIEKIGGFATGVITEDMATGMLIQAEGYETVFVNEVIAVGLAPETYKDLLKQRDRWCRGNIQVMRKYNPLTTKGLTAMQKLLYLDGMHYWFFGLYKTVYLLAPILYLVFGIIVLDAQFTSLLVFWIPAFLSSQLFAHLISDNKRTVMWSNVYDIALAPAMSWAIISELFLKTNKTFNVTRKGVYTNQRHFLWHASLFHMLLGGLSVTGLVRGLTAFIRPELVNLEVNSLYINLFWTSYNIFGLIIVLLIFFERPRYRSSERFANHVSASVLKGTHEVPVQLLDLSDNGARLTGPKDQLNKKTSTIQIKFTEDVSILAEVRWADATNNEHLEWGVRFIDMTHEQYSYLVGQLYSAPDSSLGEKSYYRPGLLPTAFNFLRQTKRIPLSQRRLIMREKVKGRGILTHGELNYSIQLIDISEEGSQVKSKHKMSVGDRVSIHAPFEEVNNRQGEVRWIKAGFQSYFIGVRFD
ncbi:glycosyltransferase [Alkalibacterium psychrotolerans]